MDEGRLLSRIPKGFSTSAESPSKRLPIKGIKFYIIEYQDVFFIELITSY